VTPAAARASTDPTHGATTPPAAPTVAVLNDELAYTLRMTDRDLPSHASAMRVAAEIRLLNPELLDQRRGIIRHLLERQRLTPQRRVPCPSSSTAITCLDSASAVTSGSINPIVISPPCRTTSGSPDHSERPLLRDRESARG
jgi:hypothetical protein